MARSDLFGPRVLAISLSILLGIPSALPVAFAQQLIWLGTGGGRRSWALDVSTDGNVVVGWIEYSQNGGFVRHAFRWTAEEGMQDLGTLPGGYWSEAWGVSADGRVVVGRAWNTYNKPRAFRWTPEEGMQDLGTLGGCCSEAWGISADGRVVVGQARNAENIVHAFRWTVEEGMQDLGTLPGGSGSWALGVSADGNTVVGESGDSAGHQHAFRWTAEEGMQDLGTLGGSGSWARAVSADGSVVVGWAQDANDDTHAFRWTLESGMLKISTLDRETDAWDVSDDGRVVVGNINFYYYYHPFLWTETGRMIDLHEAYKELLSEGSILAEARAVSPDGRYVAGIGYNAITERTEGFLLDTGTSTATIREKSPTSFRLLRSYPNPFHQETHIQFVLPQMMWAHLEVFDLLGRSVRLLLHGPLTPGTHTVVWDGCDEQGRPLPPGLYLYRLEAEGQTLSRTVVLIR